MSAVQLAYSVAASPGHDLFGHYECAKRIPAILEALQQNGLTADTRPQKVGQPFLLAQGNACKHKLKPFQSCPWQFCREDTLVTGHIALGSVSGVAVQYLKHELHMRDT